MLLAIEPLLPWSALSMQVRLLCLATFERSQLQNKGSLCAGQQHTRLDAASNLETVADETLTTEMRVHIQLDIQHKCSFMLYVSLPNSQQPKRFRLPLY